MAALGPRRGARFHRAHGLFAVLPFKGRNTTGDDVDLARGFSDDIVANLVRYSQLFVITFHPLPLFSFIILG